MGKMTKEERFMEEVELSPEAQQFAEAAGKLAGKIRVEAENFGYDLEEGCQLIEDGRLTVAIIDERGGDYGFTGLPAPVGLYLTASACGGMFPEISELGKSRASDAGAALGKIKSGAKTAAAQANGKKGGRPKKRQL